MCIRDSKFTHTLFTELNIFSIQGLTLSVDHKFTACIEAIQYEDNENIDLGTIFSVLDVKAKHFLSTVLAIPFYFLIYQNGHYFIHQVECNPEPAFTSIADFNEVEFIEWWQKIKGQK